MDKVGIVIVNYNMPERTDALARYIWDNVRYPNTLMVVDNGSDRGFDTSPHTTLQLRHNIQTTGGWLMGLHYLDQIALKNNEDYFAYWLLITSAEFVGGGDVLSPMVQVMKDDNSVVGVHPALTSDSTTSWTHLKERGGDQPRRTWMIDNIAALWRADWFDGIGRFDPKLRYGWGVDLETCFRAREEDYKLYVHEGVKIKKVTDIGYTMDRMNMTAPERRDRAYKNMEAILSLRYGGRWWSLMTESHVTEEMK